MLNNIVTPDSGSTILFNMCEQRQVWTTSWAAKHCSIMLNSGLSVFTRVGNGLSDGGSGSGSQNLIWTSRRFCQMSYQNSNDVFRLYKSRFPLQSLCPRGRSGLWKSAHAGVTGVKNNDRFARAGKANVNGKQPDQDYISILRQWPCWIVLIVIPEFPARITPCDVIMHKVYCSVSTCKAPAQSQWWR
jgi:hypothetical protein